MILPRPRVHCTGLDDIHFKLRDDGALHTPKPRNPTGICDSIEFRFSQDPKNKRTQRGSESHTSVGFLGVWGYRSLIAKVHLLDGSIPTWRVGLMVSHSPAIAATFEGGPWFSLEYDIVVPLLRDC